MHWNWLTEYNTHSGLADLGSRAVRAGFKLVQDVSVPMDKDIYRINTQNFLLLVDEMRAQMEKEWQKGPSLTISYEELDALAREEFNRGVSITHDCIVVVVQKPAV